MKIWKEYVFDSAHFLPNVPKGHKCGRTHGHSFRVRVYISGAVGDETGWVMDFTDVGGVLKPLVDSLDHRLLNGIEGLCNPTSENIAIWFWDRVKPLIPQLCAVEVSETCTSGVIYEG
jgi:6-pyruvoyltetrahydropterin/6-carboxytetrahydropterin synthase